MNRSLVRAQPGLPKFAGDILDFSSNFFKNKAGPFLEIGHYIPMIQNTTTLKQAIQALYTAHPRITVIQIVNDLSVNQPHLQVNYRKVYNTLKRVTGGISKTPKTPKVKKSSIIFDLTLEPTHAVKGVVVKRGQHCK